MSTEVNLRRFLMETKDKADEVLKQSHVGADVKAVIKDLLQIGINFQDLLELNAGQSADARVLKKKFEQMKIDSRAMENKVANAKNAVLQLATEIEVISKEAKNIRSRLVLANDPNAQSVARIDTSIQNIIKAVMQLSSL